MTLSFPGPHRVSNPQVISKCKCTSKSLRARHLGEEHLSYSRCATSTCIQRGGPLAGVSVISKNPLPSNRSIWGLLGAQFSLREKQQPDFSVWWAPWRGTCPLSLTGNSPAFCRGFLITTQQQPNLAGVTERQPPVEPQHGSVPILVLPGTIINLTLKRGLWVGGPICYFSWA